MIRNTRRFAAAFACAASCALAAPLAHAQATTETANAGESGGGFSSFMDDYVWGRNIMAVGWFHIHPLDSATPLTTSTSSLGLGTWQSPGTDVRVSNADTLSLTFTHFFDDNWAGTFVGGVPPKFNLYGSGNVIAPIPVIGPLTLINLGLPQNNPVATVREWSPAIQAEYHFGTAQSKVRPFVGVGVSYNFFTNLRLNSNFVNALQNLGQTLQLGMGQIPTGPGKVSAETSNSWTPTATVGVSYEFAKNWIATGTVSYLPLKTTSTITIRSQQGQVLATNKTDIKIDPIVFGLNLGYRF
ncbi:OmpW/AlkL family protein [Ralstonia solanacearum]|uniref:OmpW/AlkL family protein n=1 Tax=Ralstonia solanacearum TaxID=305 RepID=UPI0012A22948|nr:OmpW family outer membrane protein [Ralstonia solanacearum]AYB52468.2 OmpW family protein [Ralstonia solanacearum]AYB57033.1 OmpW family protein [Ralstonia solanacearum]